MSGKLSELSEALAEATEKAATSAVAVHTESRGSTSGVIWRKELIVTAEHALRRDEEIKVTLPDGRVVGATLAGRDPSTDLAILKCPDAAPGSAQFGDAAILKPGALTLVVGRTRISGPVAALGVVSLVAPERRSWTGSSIAPYIRLDVDLQPISVGGAVVNAHGQIVGIATPRFARLGALVVPAAQINRVEELVRTKGHIPRGYLGVGLQTVRLSEGTPSLQPNQKTGAIVLEVEPNSPAHQAKMLIGDVLISIGGQPVARFEDVQAHLTAENIDKSLAAKVLRGGEVQDLTIKIVERPHGEN